MHLLDFYLVTVLFLFHEDFTRLNTSMDAFRVV
jgi:hypothetical protein